MKIKYSLKTVLIGLKTNKARSFLTILGIVIGITSIILIMSIGQSAESLILNEVKSLGGNFVQINPGKEVKGPQDMADTLFNDSLKERDIKALKNKNNVPDLEEITPSLMVPGSVSYKGETYKPTILGWTADWMAKLYNIYPGEGEYFTEEDIKSLAAVAVIGAKVKEDLFGTADALGEKIKIKDKYFKVVAIFPAKGQVSSFMDIDKFVLIPYTTAQKYLLGIDYYQEIHVMAKNEESVPNMVEDIKLTLRDLHNIDDPEDDDFHITTSEEMIETISLITGILTVLLTSVAAISLVVGGVGIMNIMLVAVTEKTWEIGLRKAIGARGKDIMVHFLIESIILTIVGGLIGVGLGIGLSYLASLVLAKQLSQNWQFVISFPSILLGLGVAGSIGIIFGLYPAKKASKKSPIEALRYE
ncbi:MAG: ABC transporter permease [Patescibacteria group bacterium]|jgi:putative ABC transport system permease protein|nr:ABC transporter permease [Patescibacteria group bacterium]MDD5173094.1 ABC transporter permease [Patescibacteria group bacterium]